MSLTMDNVYQILDFLDANESCSLSIDAGDVKISITKGHIAPTPIMSAPGAPAAPVVAPVVAPAATATPTPASAIEVVPKTEASAVSGDVADSVDESGLIPVTANVTSVFYRAPSPTEPPFVEVGDMVDKDTCVCLLEVMKCYYQTCAGAKGRIAKILVNDADIVEAGTVLFLIEPM